MYIIVSQNYFGWNGCLRLSSSIPTCHEQRHLPLDQATQSHPAWPWKVSRTGHPQLLSATHHWYSEKFENHKKGL